jgi:hypothetical protein
MICPLCSRMSFRSLINPSIIRSKPWSDNSKNCVLLLSAKEDRCWKSNLLGAGQIAQNIPEWKMQVKSQKTLLFQQCAFLSERWSAEDCICFLSCFVALIIRGWFLDCPWVRLRIMFLSASTCMYHFAACMLYRVELSPPINEFRFRLFRSRLVWVC